MAQFQINSPIRSRQRRQIYFHIQHKNWDEVLAFLTSDSIQTKAKEKALMNTSSHGRLKSPFLILACSYNAPLHVIQCALDICGKDLVMHTNVKGETVLHCNINHPIERCRIFLEMAGKDVLLMRIGPKGLSTLHHVFLYKRPSIEEVLLYLQYGGKDLLFFKDDEGRSTLQCALSCRQDVSILTLLINKGGKDLVLQMDNDGFIALDYFFFYCNVSSYTDNDKLHLFTLLVQTAGFDQCAGGLFMTFKDCPSSLSAAVSKTKMKLWYEAAVEGNVRWCLIYPVFCIAKNVIGVVTSLFQGRPLLQLAIPHVSKYHLVQLIGKCHECMYMRDKNGKVPIEVAYDVDLGWENGMKELLRATVSSDEYSRSMLVLSCTYGFKWKNGGTLEKIVTEECSGGELCKIDKVSGLYPALIAASTTATRNGRNKKNKEEKTSNLDAVYKLIRQEPYILFSTKLSDK
jgi:hypothetical protein